MGTNLTAYRAIVAQLIAFLLICVFTTREAKASGTPAGTVIRNSAAVTYTMGASNFTATSNTATVTVAELLDLGFVWQDAGPVAVLPGQTDRVVTYRLTNTGNGSDRYLLSATSSLGGDNFDPALIGIYLDTNGNGIYDPGIDTLYVPGTNDPVLSSDAVTTIFVLNSIPATGLAQNDVGFTRLTATSRTGTGLPGTVFVGQGTGGVDAVVGASGGSASSTASYVVNDTRLNLVKSAVVTDPSGGSQLVTGSTIRYTISVTVAGAGIATGVVITDPIPAYTSYSPGTLRLNGVSLTDAADGDAGDAGVTLPGAVSVRLGNLTSASPVQTITFDVKIN